MPLHPSVVGAWAESRAAMSSGPYDSSGLPTPERGPAEEPFSWAPYLAAWRALWAANPPALPAPSPTDSPTLQQLVAETRCMSHADYQGPRELGL